MAGQAWKKGALAALLLASLLAGCLLAFLPAWERRGGEEKEAALLTQIQEAAREWTGEPCSAGEPMEELAEERLAGKQAEKTAQGQWEKEENGAGQETLLVRGKLWKNKVKPKSPYKTKPIAVPAKKQKSPSSRIS